MGGRRSRKEPEDNDAPSVLSKDELVAVLSFLHPSILCTGTEMEKVEEVN